MVNLKPNKTKQQQQQQQPQQNGAAPKQTTANTQQNRTKQKRASHSTENKKKLNAEHLLNYSNNNHNNNNTISNDDPKNKTNNSNRSNIKPLQNRNINENNHNNNNTNTTNNNNNNNNKNNQNKTKNANQYQQQNQPRNSYRNSTNTYAETLGSQSQNTNNNRNTNNKNNNGKTRGTQIFTNSNSHYMNNQNNNNNYIIKNTVSHNDIKDIETQPNISTINNDKKDATNTKLNAGDILTAALAAPCAKCSSMATTFSVNETNPNQTFNLYEPFMYTSKQYRKSKSYVGGNSRGSNINTTDNKRDNYNGRNHYYRSLSDRRSSFDRNFAERNKDFVPIIPPLRPILSSSNIAAVIADFDKLTIIERLGKGRTSYPIMQCGTLDAPDSSYHQQRSIRMDAYQIDDGFHSDGGTETPPPSPSSGSSIASTSDHGSLESVDTGGTQRLAVLSFEQVRKLHDVMDEKVAIHGRGNFPTLEVTLKDLVNSVRRKLEADVASGGAGVIVKDIRLNGGAASHVLAPEDQPYNDLDLIYAIELTSPRHFDRVKTAVLNTLLDLLPEGVSKRRIMPCALKEAYVGKMVKVNNNNDGDRWSLISLGNSPGHKNVELKFVDTMRRQFEFSVDSFQIVLDSLLLFYDCAALPISENFYPTVVGESVYGDFQEALYHLQKKLISTRQPEEIRGGGLLKYCNLLVRNYKPADPQRIKTLERYMCSRFFIDFPDINTQTVKLEAYLRNHFWGVDEEPLQYQYLMHLRGVVEQSTVCLMGHERRQTLLLIQSLAAQVRYKEQQKQHQQHAHAQQEQYQQYQHQQYQQQQQQQQQQLQQHVIDTQQQTQTQQATVMVAQHQQNAQQSQTIYVQQAPQQPQSATLCCTITGGDSEQTQTQAQATQQQTSNAAAPQTIQIQAGPAGLIYANGVYYAPVIPTTICTCNQTWLST